MKNIVKFGRAMQLMRHNNRKTIYFACYLLICQSILLFKTEHSQTNTHMNSREMQFMAFNEVIENKSIN